jgi:hypothetical protein
MYGDPLFVNAELDYRRQLFAAGSGRVGASRRHGHRWADRLHVRLHHRHATQVRPA